MKDRWYADNRDLVKWGVLLRLADAFEVQRIVQLAFYRSSTFGQINIDGQEQDLPAEVISHFTRFADNRQHQLEGSGDDLRSHLRGQGHLPASRPRATSGIRARAVHRVPRS